MNRLTGTVPVKLLHLLHPRPHIAKERIRKHQRRHALAHDGRPEPDHRIVPALHRDAGLLMIPRHGLLRQRNRRRRLKTDPHRHIGPVADPAEYAAGVIGPLADVLPVHVKCVVIFAPEHLCRRGTFADINSLDRADREHRLREIRVQLLKDRISETCRQALYGELHRAADRIALLTALPDQLSHRLLIGNVDAPHAAHMRLAGNPQAPEELLRDSPAGHAHGGLPPGGSSASAVVAETVFFIKPVIRMAGPVNVFYGAVIAGALVFIFQDHRDRRSGRLPFEHA